MVSFLQRKEISYYVRRGGGGLPGGIVEAVATAATVPNQKVVRTIPNATGVPPVPIRPFALML
jgi:hypothetical protein